MKTYNKVFKNFKDTKQIYKKCYEYLTSKKYESFIMDSMPIRARGGEACLYKSEHITMTFPDQYIWKESETYLNKEGIEKKRYYISHEGGRRQIDAGFSRIIYYIEKIPIQNRIYLIYYKGDEKIGLRENVKTGKPHVATHKKILASLRGMSKEAPQNIYTKKLYEANYEMKEKGISGVEYEKCYFSKNPRQIQNKISYEKS